MYILPIKTPLLVAIEGHSAVLAQTFKQQHLLLMARAAQAARSASALWLRHCWALPAFPPCAYSGDHFCIFSDENDDDNKGMYDDV